QLDPTQEWAIQLGILILGIVMGAAIYATVTFFAVQPLYVRRPLAGANLGSDLVLAIALALALSGVNMAMEIFWPSTYTPGPNRGHLDASLPWLAALLSPLGGMISVLLQLLLLVGLMGFFTARWRLQLVIFLAVVWFIAAPFGADEPWRSVIFNLLTAIKLILAYQLIRRNQLGVAMAFLLLSNLVLAQTY